MKKELKIFHFKYGKETLDYLFEEKEEKDRMKDIAFILLLNIKMPGANEI